MTLTERITTALKHSQYQKLVITDSGRCAVHSHCMVIMLDSLEAFLAEYGVTDEAIQTTKGQEEVENH